MWQLFAGVLADMELVSELYITFVYYLVLLSMAAVFLSLAACWYFGLSDTHYTFFTTLSWQRNLPPRD